MKRIKASNKGYTLIEIIVSIALIGIIAAFFLTAFSTGYGIIFSNGRKTQAMNSDAQMYLDKVYNNEISIPTTSVSYDNVTITNLGTMTVASTGITMKVIEITAEYPNEKSVTLKSLVP